jgi:hypothetical protein
MKQETKNCQNCKQDFVIDQEDFNFYEKMKVPPPTFCPLCRAQRRWAFRNERGLYKRKCDFSGKEIFSMYAPDSPVKVYDRDIWLSDVWDPMEYGKDIDWSKPFLSQFYEMMLEVPFKSNNVIRGINSPYLNNATDPKNSYLIFNTNHTEDSMYSNGIDFSKDCVDVSHVNKGESCYESFWLELCYRTHYSAQCAESSDLWFCRDCYGCMNCFGSINLRNKNYYFFNQQYNKADYQKKLQEYNLHTRDGIERAKKEAWDFWKKFPSKNIQGIKNLNSNGSYITNSKNVKDSFLIREGENLRYCQYLQATPGVKDSYDYSNWGEGAELMYEVVISGAGVQNIKFSYLCQESSHDIEYSISCQGSENLFGCVSLRKKSYCILNKQYTKEEYIKLVEKIKKHMKDIPYVDNKGRMYRYGEFFPMEFSPLSYNESIAQEYFPLTKEEVIEKGYRWRDVANRDYKPTIFTGKFSDDITQTPDSITGEIFECAHKEKCNQGCTKAFRIIPNELQFYKKIGVPIPTLCPACRTMERLKIRLGIKLYESNCMCAGEKSSDGEYKNYILHTHGQNKCENKFKTGYNPKDKNIVYCESCYQQEVD